MLDLFERLEIMHAECSTPGLWEKLGWLWFLDINVWTCRIWLQVFGFLLGIDLKGMSGAPGGAGEDGDDQMRDVRTPPPATQAQSEAQQAKEKEEEEVRYRPHGVPSTLRLSPVVDGLACVSTCAYPHLPGGCVGRHCCVFL